MAVDNSDSLRRSLANVEAQIEALTASPFPDHNLDGQGTQWGTHLERLMRLRQSLVELIVQADGPVEIHVVGLT